MSKSKKAVFLHEWKEQVGTNMEHFHEGAALMVRKHQSQHRTRTRHSCSKSEQSTQRLPVHHFVHSSEVSLCAISHSGNHHTESNQKTTAFATTLHDMASHEYSPPLKTALDTLSTELKASEVARTQLLAQLQAHVVNEFSKYPHKLRVQDVNIRARNKAFEKFVKKQKAFVAMKGHAKPEKQAIAKEVFEHERKRLQGAETTLNTSLSSFEASRVREMQVMLKKYISSQLHFFARSMEGLSSAYARVCEIDPDREGARLVEEMQRLESLEQKDDHAAEAAAAGQVVGANGVVGVAAVVEGMGAMSISQYGQNGQNGMVDPNVLLHQQQQQQQYQLIQQQVASGQPLQPAQQQWLNSYQQQLQLQQQQQMQQQQQQQQLQQQSQQQQPQPQQGYANPQLQQSQQQMQQPQPTQQAGAGGYALPQAMGNTYGYSQQLQPAQQQQSAAYQSPPAAAPIALSPSALPYSASNLSASLTSPLSASSPQPTLSSPMSYNIAAMQSPTSVGSGVSAFGASLTQPMQPVGGQIAGAGYGYGTGGQVGMPSARFGTSTGGGGTIGYGMSNMTETKI